MTIMTNGIDISSWQNGISADAINSVEFAIFKISEGQTWVDPCFNSFYEVARIPVGAYVFSHAVTEEAARLEARKAISLLNGRKLPLGLYMDVEDSAQLALRDSVLTAVVKAFCDEVRSAEYIPGAYGSTGQLWAKVGPSYLGDDVIVWGACWGMEPKLSLDIWQYTDHVSVGGMNVDGDRGMSERFNALVSGQGDPQPTPEPTPEPQPEPPTDGTFSLDGIPILKIGDTGAAVVAMQGELLANGYSCGGKKDWRGAEKADGIFGKVTKESVAAFQTAHNLPGTGIVDQKTRAALMGVIA